MSHGESKKAIIAALLANLGIALSKFVAFLLTASASMLAESIHSAADTTNQGLLLLGGRRAKREATEQHPFGFGRERYFWSFVVSLMLFSLGGLFALFEGVEKLLHPHELESPGIALGVLGVAIVLESFSLRTAVRESNPLRRGRSWWTFIRDAKVPELPVVLLEDVGALAGLVCAVLGVGTAMATGDARWDGAGTIAIGVLLIVIAGVLAVEMKSHLIGESADTATQERIRATISSHADVAALLMLRTLHLGPDDLLVAAKVDLRGPRDPSDSINEIERDLRSEVPLATMILIEPDHYRADYVREVD